MRVPPLLSSSHSLLDTPTSCVLPFHIGNTLLSAPLLSASLLPLLHTVLLDFPISQIYFLPSSSSSVLLYLYSSRRDVQTFCIVYTAFLLFLSTLPLIWRGPTFGWACCSWDCCIGPKILCYVLNRLLLCKKKKFIFLEGLVIFFSYLTCTSTRVQDLHSARYLLPYWLLP